MAAERLALLGVGVGHVDRCLRRPHAHSDQHHALVLEVLHRLVEATVHGAEHLLVGDPDIVEHELGRVGAQPTVLVELRGDLEPFGAGRHEEHRDPVLVVGIGSGRDDRQLAVHGVRDEHLPAVDPPAVAVLHGGGSDAGDVGDRVGFGHADRQDGVARQHPRHPLGELLSAPGVDQVRAGHVGVDEHGDIESGERRCAERLGEGRRGEHPHPETAVFRGNSEAEHAELAHLAQHVAGHLAGFFPGVAVGQDLVGHERDGLVVDRFEFVGHVCVTHRRRSPLRTSRESGWSPPGRPARRARRRPPRARRR